MSDPAPVDGDEARADRDRALTDWLATTSFDEPMALDEAMALTRADSETDE